MSDRITSSIKIHSVVWLEKVIQDTVQYFTIDANDDNGDIEIPAYMGKAIWKELEEKS